MIMCGHRDKKLTIYSDTCTVATTCSNDDDRVDRWS